MYRHFCLKHPLASLTIREDGPLERCALCGVFAKEMEKHQKTATCKKGRMRREHEEKQDRQAEAERVVFQVKGVKIERVDSFKYLGRILQSNDKDSICIEDRIKKAIKQWNCVAKILKQEGSNAKCMAKFYLAIVQAVLLYGSESWVITERDWRKLRGFHQRAIRYMTGKHIRKLEMGWEYPQHQKLLVECNLDPIESYIEQRRGTLWSYLKIHREDLLKEAMGMKRHCRDVKKIFWWDQNYTCRDENNKTS